MRNKLVSVVGVNPPADIASGRIAEVRSRSMSCNCMTRTSQQECRGILELRRTLSEKCRFFGRCSFLYCNLMADEIIFRRKNIFYQRVRMYATYFYKCSIWITFPTFCTFLSFSCFNTMMSRDGTKLFYLFVSKCMRSERFCSSQHN